MRVRNKISEVSRFFNANKGNFDAQVYQDFIKKLYRRAKNVIMTVETDPDMKDTLGEVTAQRILDAMKADQEYIDSRVQEAETNKMDLEEKLTKERHEKDNLVDQNKFHEEYICNLKKETEELKNKEAVAQEEISTKKKELEKESAKRKEAEEKIALYEQRDTLNKELETIKVDLVPLEIQRKKSFSNICPVLLIISGVTLLSGAIVWCVFAIILKDVIKSIPIGLLVPLGIFLLNKGIKLNGQKENRKREAFNRWERMTENKNYLILVNRQNEIEKQIDEIEAKLQMIKHI